MSRNLTNAQRFSRKQQQALNDTNTTSRGTSSHGASTASGRGRNQILSHLPPLDVLRMARASMAFRKMLMSRTSRHIWIASRRNAVPPLPECPNNLSEPRYAAVLFERTCQNCGASRSMNVDYAVFVRLCDNCWMARVRKGGVLAYDSGLYYDPDFMKLVFSLLPSAPYEVYKPFTSNPLARTTGDRPIKQNEHMFYHESEFDTIAGEYRKLCSGASTGSMKQFLVQHRIDTRVRLTIFEWENQTRVSRGEDLKQAKSERRIAIEEKLCDLGFEPKDFPSGNKEFDKMLDQPRNLTTRIWNNIRPKLLELLRDEQERRETAAFNRTWSFRRAVLSQHYQRFLDNRRDLDVWERMIFPRFEEAVKTPVMTNLLISARPNEHVSQEQFGAVEPEIIVDVADATAKVRRTLVRLLRGEAVEGRVSSSAATKQKASTPATESKRKDKGKARADCPDQRPAGDDSTGEDIEAAKALLEQLSSLFVCEHPTCKLCQSMGGRPFLMSFLGVLEHQSLHSPTHGTWDDIAVAVADPTWHARMPDLLDAIGLPQDSKLSAVRERILLGTARCVGCTTVPGPGGGTHEGASLCNMLMHVSGPTGVDMTTMQPVYGRHNITFHPSPRNSQYNGLPSTTGALLNGLFGLMSGGGLPVANAARYIAGPLPQDFVTPFVGVPPAMQPIVYGGSSSQAGPSRLS
ncbi:hypothetical protein LXA43DRAFT_1047721 [Ganoderma leucocontextum]|nr:hypothetical protein LXA43DRAFT_1047721 [Ganoderma leucocontextum]